MASKKNQELRALSLDELKAELIEAKVSYENLKFDHAVKGLDNPNVVKNTRRDIARISTELRRREIEEAK